MKKLHFHAQPISDCIVEEETHENPCLDPHQSLSSYTVLYMELSPTLAVFETNLRLLHEIMCHLSSEPSYSFTIRYIIQHLDDVYQ